jgi:hypothetical protein
MSSQAGQEYEYGCSTCGKGFSSYRSLTSHLRYNNDHLARHSNTPFIVAFPSSSKGGIERAPTSEEQSPPPQSPNQFVIGGNDNDELDYRHFESESFHNTGVPLVQKPDFSLIEQFYEYINTGFGSRAFNKDVHLLMNVNLLHLLMKTNAPLYLFPKLKEWAHISSTCGVDFKDKSFLRDTRQATIKKLEKQLNLEAGKPYQIEVTLRGTQQTVSITVHDFKQQVYSLLTDPSVMSDDNLLFPATASDGIVHGPFGEPKHWNDMVGTDRLRDVTDGQAYYTAWHRHVVVRGLDVLCCPIFFLDKTHVDVHGRLCIEPASFTLSIFTKEARRNPKFWRTLGIIPNQSNMQNASSAEKAIDYHHMIETIFKSVVDIQQGPGVAWKLKYVNISYDVVWKFPVLFIIGDTEGHDKMCGKYLSRTTKVNRLCRYCDCPTNSTDDPWFKIKYTSSDEISQLFRKGDLVGLKDISYHGLLNGFRDIVFCDEDRGINGATLAELLHVWEKGLFLQLMAALMGLKRAKKVASKKRIVQFATCDDESCHLDKKPAAKRKLSQTTDDNLSSDADEVVGEDDDDDDDNYYELFDDNENSKQSPDPIECPTQDYVLSQNGVFSDKVKVVFDNYAKIYGRKLSHQSDRQFNRAYFPSGISSNAKKNGHEEQCVLLLTLIIFVSKMGSTFDTAIDLLPNRKSAEQRVTQRSTAFVDMLSKTLLIHHFR